VIAGNGGQQSLMANSLKKLVSKSEGQVDIASQRRDGVDVVLRSGFGLKLPRS
jgi:hypothetical protein